MDSMRQQHIRHTDAVAYLKKNQSDISTTKAVQSDLCRISVSRNAKRVEKDALYKKFFRNFSKNY